MTQEEADEQPKLTSSTGFLLARLGAESRRRWVRLLSERGLSPHHFGVLMTLDQLGETHQQRLSAAIGVDPRNAVPIFDTLEARELITRTSDQTDRRKRAVAITAAGRTTVDELRRTGAALDDDLLAGLTDHQRRTLHGLLLTVFHTVVDIEVP
ncbi:MarR family winged helix-turn-helix transcriptional regulator [Micromonospora sp. NPDC003776]